MREAPLNAEAEAFAPGHITGFFEIADQASDPSRVGSRGAGFSVALGVRSRVRVSEEGFPGIDIRVDGRPAPAATTRRAVELLLAETGLHVEVDQTVELPVSQGFGVSAAAALSAALAAAEVLERPRSEAVWAAHTSEVMQRTGLGDVVGSARGGFEVRLEPGIEPHGRIEAWNPNPLPAKVLLCTVADALPTPKVLGDTRRRADVAAAGAEAVRAFGADRTLARFVALARRFAVAAKLAPEPVLRALDRLGPGALAAQSMLGNSVFVFSGDPNVRKTLSTFGPVIETAIDATGARITQPRKAAPEARSR